MINFSRNHNTDQKAFGPAVHLKTTQSIERNPFMPNVGSTAGGPKRDRVVRLNADLNREYVSTGWLGWQPFLRSLLHSFDDLTQEFGLQVYEQMMTDPEVFAAVSLLQRSILSEGWTIEPSVGKDHPNYNFALAMADFVRVNLENLDDDFLVTLRQSLDGLWCGSSLSEQSYRLEEDGMYEGYLTLRSIKQKQNHTTVYVVDAFFNFVGVLTARYPGQVYPAGSLVAIPTGPDGGIVPGLLPRKKFIIFSWDVHNNDPRGRSILRPVYGAWWFKQQMFTEYLSWASKFASPSIVGITAPNAVPETELDENGDVVEDENGVPVGRTPEEVMAAALQGFRNGSAIAIPNGADIKTIETGNDGNAYAEGIRVANTEIVKGITMQMLATMEGKNQSRAATDVHLDVLGMLNLYIKHLLCSTYRRDCFKPLLEYNFGKAIGPYIPRLNLSHGSGFPPTLEQIAQLSTSGYLHPSQYEALDRVLGLPRRDPASMQAPQGGVSGNGAAQAAPSVGVVLGAGMLPQQQMAQISMMLSQLATVGD